MKGRDVFNMRKILGAGRASLIAQFLGESVLFALLATVLGVMFVEVLLPLPAVSALFGDARRGLGMLNNELYVGKVIWNRRQWLKEPDTGKRRYVDRPRNEWLIRH